MKLIAGLQYRAAAWAGAATQFFWDGINLLAFSAFYKSALFESGGGPMNFDQLADFVWLRQAFLALIMLRSMDNELLEMIAGGGVSYDLCRPFTLYTELVPKLIDCALNAHGFGTSSWKNRQKPGFSEPWRFHSPSLDSTVVNAENTAEARAKTMYIG
jgi:ABC-2 type transport system permease protein